MLRVLILKRFSLVSCNILAIIFLVATLGLSCTALEVNAAETTPTATPLFASVNGPDLMLGGQKLHLKGHNFYPYQTPWSYMWSQWNGPEIQAEVAQAALLGDNVLRILVPYGDSYGWNDAKSGQVKPDYLNELRQMLQIAASFKMKVILTLFDFYGDFPADGTADTAANQTYLQTIVSAFAGDDRVLAWDLHNEPDNYPIWKTANQREAVLDWLVRMRQIVRSADANHLITIGAGSYENLWYTDGQGRSIISLSDFVGWHSYNALDFGNEVVHIREHTSKPILLEETGWPTGPSHSDPNFTDAKQSQVYQLALQTARDLNLVGVLGWKLRDEVPVGLINLEDYQNYYGLLRHNATLKPAAILFKSNLVPPLPSVIQTSLPLSAQSVDQAPRSIYFPQTDHYVATPLKELWRRAGGETIFGLPLTDAIVEHLGDDGTPFGHNAGIVQYFERARFEYYPDKIHEPEFLKYSHLDKYFYIIKFGTLGQELAGTDVQNAPKVGRSQPDGPNYQYFTNTDHDLSGPYLTFWQNHYGGQILGGPISQPYSISIAGTTVEVQYFERGRLEHHPELAGQASEIQISKLGIVALEAKGWLTPQPSDLPNSSWSDNAFTRVWRQVDGLVANGGAARSWLWGPSGFASAIEPYVEAGVQGQRLVEYFDKSRMEITKPSDDAVVSSEKSYVTNGLLVKEMISGQMQFGDNQFVTTDPAQIAVAGDPTEVNAVAPTYASFANMTTLAPSQNAAPDRTGATITTTLDKGGKVGNLPQGSNLVKLAQNISFISQTQHNIPDVFWKYLTQSRGPLLLNLNDNSVTVGDTMDWTFSVGLPITEAYWIRAKIGGVEQDALVQAFERRILTYTPSNPTAFQVEMGNVGRHYYNWRYLSGNFYVQIGQQP